MVLKDKKTKIIYHQGVNTIGGTNIEIIYDDSHIFFDLGTEFRPTLKLPDETYKTLIKNKLIPKLNDFYDENLDGAPKWENKFKHSAAFISHLHLDHTKMLNFVDQRIPIYSSFGTIEILKTLNQSGSFLLPAAKHPQNYMRNIIAAKMYEPIKIGDITVELYPVDHDASGAVALFIHTPDKFIVYTGDLRMHGFNPEFTQKMLKSAKNCDLLICEGVGVSFPDNNQKDAISEKELLQSFINKVNQAKNRPIVFNTYPGNIARLINFCNYCPRKIVLTAKRAQLIKKITNKEFLYYYLPNEEKIEELNPIKEVSYKALLKDKTEFVWQIEDNFDKLQPYTLYIHSDAEPLGDFDPKYQKFLNCLKKHQVEFVALACSGHATAQELDEIIAGIKPQLLTTIHSFHPEKLKNPFGKCILVQNGQRLILY
nr:MBL fold metallo-hydrolase [uncultured Ligilactobacillus sp.]